MTGWDFWHVYLPAGLRDAGAVLAVAFVVWLVWGAAARVLGGRGQ